mmetsp:Transcript_14977/g.37702  ORF Transcript_14977/g.37702 Transcript_14977/m.37702 type:complete len:157 (-) Transcript_14977:67-537(-)
MSSSARLRRALLVVDMTVEQLDDIPLSERQRLLHAVSTLITSLDWDWIVDARLWIETHQTTSLAWLYPNVGIANTSGAELHESVRSLLNDKELTHIAKTHYSAFFENDLDEQFIRRVFDFLCFTSFSARTAIISQTGPARRHCQRACTCLPVTAST